MKFSIRDLFLVTMIVALAVGWLVDRSRLARRGDKAETEAEHWKEILELGERYGTYPARQLPNSSAPAPNSPKP